MIQKLLLIGPNFRYFLVSIGRAFEGCGYQVHTCAYDNPIHPYTTFNKWKYKFAHDKEALKQQSRRHYDSYIREQFNQIQPELVFILNSDNLQPCTLDYFRQTSTVVIWLFDSVKRFPVVLENLSHADQVFCYEQNDIPYIKEQLGITASFLPQAVDETLYYPTSDSQQLILSFAGDIWQSQRRQSILQHIVKHYGHLPIRIWGIYKPWYKGFWQWLTRERRDIYMNRNTTAEVLNTTYNQSRIVLNIHGEQQKNGANPKVYEIAATKAYQICDANPYIESLFQHGEVGLYHNEEEMFQLIDYALNHDMSAQAQAAYDIVTSQHTFTLRIQQMLQLVNKSIKYVAPR